MSLIEARYPMKTRKNRIALIIAAAAITLIWSPSFAHTLEWKMKQGDHVEIVKTANVIYRINNENQNATRERNIIDLYCTGVKNERYSVKSLFSLYSLGAGETVFKLDKKTESSFEIARDGTYFVDAKTFLPNLRSIPSFPAGDVAENATWTKPGSLVFDNFSVPFMVEMPVNYRLAKVTTENGTQLAEILFQYVVDYTLTGQQFPKDFPAKIIGHSEGVVLWDLSKNIPVAIKENYQMAFVFANNQVVMHEWLMGIETAYNNYEPKKETPASDLSKEIAPESGVTIKENERGLVFSLGEVLFDFNSADIRKDSAEVIDKIAAIIKRDYPDREIIVEGHTDDTGSSYYNKDLSEKRAGNVAEEVMSQVGHDKVSYIGHGEKFPIEKNDTIEGRKKNRRVDIVVKVK